jgi:hypothetical protein
MWSNLGNSKNNFICLQRKIINFRFCVYVVLCCCFALASLWLRVGSTAALPWRRFVALSWHFCGLPIY